QGRRRPRGHGRGAVRAPRAARGSGGARLRDRRPPGRSRAAGRPRPPRPRADRGPVPARGERAPPSRDAPRGGLVSEAVERAKSQGWWLALGQIASRAAQFLSTIVLARILAPEHFGKIAIASVVWEVVALFGNTGVAATIVKAGEIDGDLLDAAFWLNATVAC